MKKYKDADGNYLADPDDEGREDAVSNDDDNDDDIIAAGSRLPFVQVGMIIRHDDAGVDGMPPGEWLVSAIHESDVGDIASLEDEPRGPAAHGMRSCPGRLPWSLAVMTSEWRIIRRSCSALRREWRLARDFDPSLTYTGRWRRGHAEVERDA